VATQAGKAAPAMAIAGALVAVPQAQHAPAASSQPTTVTAQAHETDQAEHKGAQSATATLDSVATRAVTVASTAKARHAALVSSTRYTVRGGDTLSKIAQHFYHRAADWQYLYHENQKTLANPDMIRAGETLFIPASVPASYKLTDYVPRHAAPAASSEAGQDRDSSGASSSGGTSAGGTVLVQSASQASTGSSAGLSGTLSCSGLEKLWEQAGGSSGEAFIAAEIAMAESGGNPNAISPTDDFGLWQINGSNGALATLNPFQNAKSAITLSDNGTNWNPWTTYHSGAYSGRC
jgi:LysM repeat protein